MTQETKIFVSHHHSDKVLLARVKAWLKHYGIRLFLAHDDIEVGKIDYDAIREGIVNSDAFFAYGSEAAMQSPACNQEIGMAMALGGKPTIWAITPPNRPWGIMTPLQSIIIKSGDEDEVAGALFYDLLMTIENIIRPASTKEQQNAMSEALFDEFVIWNAYHETYPKSHRIITLQPVLCGFNYNEQSSNNFHIHHDGTQLGVVRIVCTGQSKGQLTETFLPPKFPFLGNDYRSAIEFNEGCNIQLRGAVSRLLNDIKNDIELAKNFKDKFALNILLMDDTETKKKLDEPDDDGFGDMEDIPF